MVNTSVTTPVLRSMLTKESIARGVVDKSARESTAGVDRRTTKSWM